MFSTVLHNIGFYCVVKTCFVLVYVVVLQCGWVVIIIVISSHCSEPAYTNTLSFMVRTIALLYYTVLLGPNEQVASSVYCIETIVVAKSALQCKSNSLLILRLPS